jgi:hypothetical protein
MRKRTLVGILLLVISPALGALPAYARKDCRELLAGTAYMCTATNETTPSSSGILAFTLDLQAQGLNVVFDAFGFGPCYYGAKGNFKKPDLDATTGFTCIDTSQTEVFFMGTATRKKSRKELWSWGITCIFLNVL